MQNGENPLPIEKILKEPSLSSIEEKIEYVSYVLGITNGLKNK